MMREARDERREMRSDWIQCYMCHKLLLKNVRMIRALDGID